MPNNLFEFNTEGSGDFDPTASNWEEDAFSSGDQLSEDSPVGENVMGLLEDLGVDNPEDYMKYLDKYDPQKEIFAGMQQELSQAGAQSAYDQSMASTELGMRSAMGGAEAGAKSQMGKMLQAGRQVGGFGGRQRAMEQGKEDVMAQRSSAMDKAKTQADISKTAASDSYSQSMGAADLAYQQSVHGAREDWQDDIFSMITNIVQMVNA